MPAALSIILFLFMWADTAEAGTSASTAEQGSDAKLRTDKAMMRHQSRLKSKDDGAMEPADSESDFDESAEISSDASVDLEDDGQEIEDAAATEELKASMDKMISTEIDHLVSTGTVNLNEIRVALGIADVAPTKPPPAAVPPLAPCDMPGASETRVLVLSTDDTTGWGRVGELQGQLALVPSSGITYFGTVHGLDYAVFTNEEVMMHAPGFELDAKARQEWEASKIRRGLDLKAQLAPALGHRHLWKRAAAACPGTWTVILEDDVRPLGPKLADVLAKVPPGVSQVFLDGRHCKGFVARHWNLQSHGSGFVVNSAKPRVNFHLPWSAAAYALRPEAAQALLEIPFDDNLDFLLNHVLADGRARAYCPASHDVVFTAEYEHPSHLNRGYPSYHPSVLDDLFMWTLNVLSDLTGNELL